MGKTDERGITLVNNQAYGAVAVTPNDSADLATLPTKGLFVGGTGDVSVVMFDGTSAVFKGLAGGIIHPLAVKRVNATNTNATDIVAVY